MRSSHFGAPLRFPWYTTVGDAFQTERGTTEFFKLDVYLRDGERAVPASYDWWRKRDEYEPSGSAANR